MTRLPIKRGDVVLVDLRGAEGVEKSGVRPCLVVQNNGGNASAPFTVIAPITDASAFKGYPSQVLVASSDLGSGSKDSVIECGHLRTIDRDLRILRNLSRASTAVLRDVDHAIQRASAYGTLTAGLRRPLAPARFKAVRRALRPRMGHESPNPSLQRTRYARR